MPGLELFVSNRLEVLIDLLAELLEEPLASPLDKETIVVQSTGMERWVSMELAKRHGVCANMRFLFPNALVDYVFSKVLNEIPESLAFDPAVMSWKIMRLLPTCLGLPAFDAPRKYLVGEAGQLKLFQLSQTIAHLFDQYVVFRPDMVLEWENSQSYDDDWQQQLWRELVKETDQMHRALLRDRLFAILRQVSSPPAGLPNRLTIFGISSLPPFHMEILHELSRFMPVFLFLMNPCREYWGDIRSEREIGRITRQVASMDATPESLHLEMGNTLLASMGILGREFLHLLQDVVGQEHEHFLEAKVSSLLSSIQTDVLFLRDRDSRHKTQMEKGDRSIAVQSCHSPMREIEVLYDQLLALFEEEPDLGPKDVLVMTPDNNAYAPFIHAVFDSPEQSELKIPFSITDRNLRRESRITETFLALLDLVASRMGAPQVLALMESIALRRRFDIAESDLELIYRWVKDTRICWGINAESRVAMGLGEFNENTWQAGLERLLLGYALPGSGANMFQAILPYDHIEGSDTQILGRFLEFIQCLFEELSSLAHPRPLSHWAQALNGMLDRFFAPDANEEKEVLTIRKVLNDFQIKQETANFKEAVDIEVIRCSLVRYLESETASLGFITGGVTFCAMLPMRSIPFEVICLVGMNEGDFPRQRRVPGFDLMARTPRIGDRSQRNDDRYLFLEAILSARRRLYISYVGQSLEDNSTLPPSVLVSELMDAIRRGFVISCADDIVEHITTRHRLQSFSTQYYKCDDPKFFSYSSEGCRTGMDIQSQCPEPRPFVDSEIDEPEAEWRNVTIDQLAAFFVNPVKFLLRRRLQIQLETGQETVEDRENFELNPLERYLLVQDLLDKRISGLDLRDMFPLANASGQLPHGTVGVCGFDLMSAKAENIFGIVEPYLKAVALPPHTVEMKLEPFLISGQIDRITAMGLIRFRGAKIKATDRLHLWIRHLIMSCRPGKDVPHSSFLIGEDEALSYRRVNGGREVLSGLLAIYWGGLRRPLHFFPRSSYVYAKNLVEGKSRAEALKNAKREWMGGGSARALPGEREDEYLMLSFEGFDPLDAEFESLAMEIFQPLMDHETPVNRKIS